MEISKVAQDAIEEAVKSYPENWKGGVCAFSYINKISGESNGERQVGPCHYYLINCQDEHVVVDARKPGLHGINKDFTLWVSRESPYSHGVLNKDDEKQLINNAMTIDVEKVGRGGALWLCKASRHFKEDTWVPGFWSQLREQGLDGLQAFIGASILDANGEKRYGTTHVALYGYGSPVNLRKTYDKVKEGKKLETFAVSTSLPFGDKPWGDMKGGVVKKPDGWGGFIQMPCPGDAKNYAAMLKEIFEGDPKNVG